MITVIGTPVGSGFPVAIPVATVINVRLPSQFKEPRRIGGGEIGSEPIDFRGISHNVTEKDRQDSYSLCSLYWKVRSLHRDIYTEASHKRSDIIFSSSTKSQNWKRKNMVGYYKWDMFGNLNFIDWDIVSSDEHVVVGRELC